MYPVIFPGLGRGLDFLLPSFLVSRQEKKVEARRIRPTEYHFNDDECAKRDTFSRYNDLIIWERITFLGYSFHRWNVLGAYAIRPYCVTGKRIAFLRYNDLIIRKRITFLGYLFHRWNVWRAYSIRPYRVTGKRIAFLKYNDQIIRKRDSFFGYIDLGIWKSGALPPCPYLLFFPWWKKRRQKKIKASAEAGEVSRVRVGVGKWIEE